MDIKIIEDSRNALLDRRELTFTAAHDGSSTPSRITVKNALAVMLGVSEDILIVDHMDTKFGKSETRGYAKIYDSEERMKVVEYAHILERNTVKREEIPEEEPAQAGEAEVEEESAQAGDSADDGGEGKEKSEPDSE